MSYEKITVEIKDGVGVVSLNVPTTINALSTAMMDEVTAAFDNLEKETRAIVLTGTGRGFCSGWELSPDVSAVIESPDYDAGSTLQSHINEFMRRIRGLSVPLVTAVHGAAAGVGCSIALAGDMVIAGRSAYFLQAFSKIGLIADGGSTHLLVRTIGRARAMDMILRARKLPAETAFEWGLVNRVVADEDLGSAALELGRELASGARSLSIARQLIWEAVDAPFDDMLEAERRAQREAGRTRDHREGVVSFLEKRPAKFCGE